MTARKRRISKNVKVTQLSNFFIKRKKLMTEQEYKEVSKLEKPQEALSINLMFGSYEAMLKELELGPLGKEVIALKPKPKPAIKKPKAPAKPRVVKPAKAKESKDE